MDFSQIGFYSTCETLVGATSTIEKCYNPGYSYLVQYSMILFGGLVVYVVMRFAFR